MKIRSVEGDFAKVAAGRLTRTINIQMLPDIKIGEYVLVHVGFAIEKVDAKKAEETLRIFNTIETSDPARKRSYFSKKSTSHAQD